MAEIILGVQHIHQAGIMHRDLKPKNILIGRDGHLLLADFGLSKRAVRTRTRCGTPEYTAPELADPRSHSTYDGRAADLFSLGVVLYEMLTGKTPFRGPHPKATYCNILNKYPDFGPIPADLDTDEGQNIRDLLLGLLEKDPAKRFTVEDVVGHPFFAGLDWSRVLQKAYDPPFEKPQPAKVGPRTLKVLYSCASNGEGWTAEPVDPFKDFDQVFRDRLQL